MKNIGLALVLASICTLVQAPDVLAQPQEAIDAINVVGGANLSTVLEGEDGGTILAGIMSAFLPLFNLVAVIILVITGLILIISQDEGQLETARKTLGIVAAAFVLVNVSLPVANSLTRGFSLDYGGNGSVGASLLSAEILGFIDFIEVPIVFVAVIMILISGIRAIAAFGTEQGATTLRRTVFAVAIGILIITAKIVLTTAIGANEFDVFIQGNPDSSPLVELIHNMLFIIIGFMALAAVIMIIIAGIIMVANTGNQEVAEKARGIIFRTIIGLIVILISGGLVTIVLA